MLGVAKVLGVIVLLIPDRLPRLKEWVFAGIFFDIIFPFGSKVSVLGIASTTDAVIAFVMVSTTYLMFRKIYDGSLLVIHALLTLTRNKNLIFY